jgi:hypothetical protein
MEMIYEHAVEMSSGTMICTPNFINIASDIKNLTGGDI